LHASGNEKPVAAYLAAEQAKDAEQLSLCFTADGPVRDEGRDHRGREAIRTWHEAANQNYRYTVQPLERSNAGKRSNCARPPNGRLLALGRLLGPSPTPG